MFNFTVNDNKKVRCSDGTIYEYKTYREAFNMGDICYENNFDICYSGIETIYNIKTDIAKILKMLNNKEDILGYKSLFKYQDKLYLKADGKRVLLGKLKNIKDNYIFIF